MAHNRKDYCIENLIVCSSELVKCLSTLLSLRMLLVVCVVTILLRSLSSVTVILLHLVERYVLYEYSKQCTTCISF